VPSVDDNRVHWDSDVGWPHSGDAWSNLWGSPRAQWHGSILPRIYPFLPAPTILEIAMGMGRWTDFLLPSCERLIGVDLAEKCVEACRARFSSDPKAEFHRNDGRSIDMVEDQSVDFAFTFDSLVHADDTTLNSYVEELGRTLKADGVAFVHHSNLGSYGPFKQRLADGRSRLPQVWTHRRFLGAGMSVEYPEDVGPVHPTLNAPGRRPTLTRSAGWRDPGPSAKSFMEACSKAGLTCVSQELVPWFSGNFLIDCFSLVTRPDSRWDRSHRVVKNPYFMDEGRSIGSYSAAYEDVRSLGAQERRQ
jgi:SAM-dependent methyltransferase